MIYDGGYKNDAGTFTLYIPINKVVVFGYRAGATPIAEYRIVDNANNPNGAPGPYTRVEESTEVPIRVKVHDGHNGGPVIYYPSDIIVLSV